MTDTEDAPPDSERKDGRVVLPSAVVGTYAFAIQGCSEGLGMAESNIPPTFGHLRYDSVRFPPENGEHPDSGDNGAIRLFDTNALTRGSRDGDRPIFAPAGDFAIILFVTIPETYQGLQRIARILGTTTPQTAPNNLTIGFRGGRQGAGAASRADGMRFFAALAGAHGTGGVWQADSAPIPDNGGKFCVAVRKIGDRLHVDFWNGDSFMKTACPGPTAIPPGWAGIARFGQDIVIGGADADRFPWFPWAATPYFGKAGIPSFRGEVGDILFVDGGFTDGQVATILAGGDIERTAGSNRIRLHAPLAGNGASALSVTSNMPSSPSLSVMGKVYPGSTLRRQTSARYLTIDRIPDPGLIAREYGARTAPMRFAGTRAGLSGALQCRLLDEQGAVVRDWHDPHGAELSPDDRWAAWIDMPLIGNRAQHAEFRFQGTPEIVARVNTRMLVGAAVQVWGQSEADYALGEIASLQWVPYGDRPTVNRWQDDAGRHLFKMTLTTLNGPTYVRHAQYDPSIMGAAGTEIGNYWAARADEPLFLICQTQPGTSRRALMSDSGDWKTIERSWDDAIRVAGQLANRGRRGEIVITGNVDGCWDAADSSIPYPPAILVPWFQGRGSPRVPADQIDHFLYDGTFSLNATNVVMPSNRGTLFDEQAVSDRHRNAEIRESFYMAVAMFGAIMGPETTLHRLENEVKGSGHPKPNTLDGDVEMARAFAEGICLAAGHGSYAGPARFTALAWVPGSGNRQVLATLKAPGGEGALTNKAGTKALKGFEAKLSAAGDWAYTHIAAAEIVDARTVRITLAAPGTPGETQITYLPGMPGGYAAAYDEAWRNGCALYQGWPVAGSNTPIGTI